MKRDGVLSLLKLTNDLILSYQHNKALGFGFCAIRDADKVIFDAAEVAEHAITDSSNNWHSARDEQRLVWRRTKDTVDGRRSVMMTTTETILTILP